MRHRRGDTRQPKAVTSEFALGCPFAVQPHHQQHISGCEPGEHLAQLRTVRLRAARDFTGHGDRTCGCQSRDLRRDALAVCGDSRRAVHSVHRMHLSFAPWKPHGISALFFVRKW
jgi:hypothetical protein